MNHSRHCLSFFLFAFLCTLPASATTVWNVNVGNSSVSGYNEITGADDFRGAAAENTADSTWNGVSDVGPVNLSDSTGNSSDNVEFWITPGPGATLNFGGQDLITGEKIFHTWIKDSANSNPFTVTFANLPPLAPRETYALVLYSDWWWKNGSTGQTITQTEGSGMSDFILNRYVGGDIAYGNVGQLLADTDPANVNPPFSAPTNYARLNGLTPDGNGRLSFLMGGVNSPINGLQLVKVDAPPGPTPAENSLNIDEFTITGGNARVGFTDTTLGVKNYTLKQSTTMLPSSWSTVPGTVPVVDPDSTAGHSHLFDPFQFVNPGAFQKRFLRIETTYKDPNDWDMDGLTNAFENTPRPISYTDANGETQQLGNDITSDPLNPDSDGDGLSDFAEVEAGSNPNSSDSDFDTIPDADENNLHGSDPTMVDTDGDGDRDGAEVNTYRTSPAHADTDADTISDRAERLDGKNPLIAQLPSALVTVVPGSVDLKLDFTFTQGSDQTVETTLGNSTGQEETLGRSDSRSVETTTERSVELSVGVEATAGVPPSASVSVTATAGVSQAVSNGRSWSVDQSSSRSSQQSYEESVGYSTSESVENSGGRIIFEVDVTNEGEVAFEMSELLMAAYLREPTAPEEKRFLGDAQWGGGSSFLLLPTQTKENMTFQIDVNALDLQEAMRDPSLLSLEVKNFNLLDRDGINLGWIESDVLERTARVIIDYGGASGRDVETYRVATEIERNGGQSTGVSLRTVLTEPRYLEIPFTTAINPVRGEVLNGVRGVTTATPNPNGTNRAFWAIASTDPAIDDPNDPSDFTPFDQIRLFKGYDYYLMYVRDLDGDGLWAREEAVLGSSDSDTNSDSDTIPDYEEARVGWNVSVAGRTTYKAFSDPSDPDVDQDGVLDHVERANGTDPRLADTDGDGRSDDLEINDSPDFLDPLDPDDPTPPLITLSPDPPVPTAGNVTIAGQASDPDDGLAEDITIAVAGHSQRTIGASGSQMAFSEGYTFTTPGIKTFTITATNAIGQVTTKEVDVNIASIFPITGLVGEFLFTNDAQNSVVNSKGASGFYYPHLSGPPWVVKTTNRFGTPNTALAFDDTDNTLSGEVPYVKLGTSRYGSEVTIAMWVKPNGPGDVFFNQLGWIQIRMVKNTFWPQVIIPDLSQPSHQIYSNPLFSVRQLSLSPATLADGQWNFVAVTIGATANSSMTISLYRGLPNGSFGNLVQAHYPNTSPPPNPGKDNPNKAMYLGVELLDEIIGALNEDDVDSTFDGSVDDVRIYNRALTPAEVEALYYEPNN